MKKLLILFASAVTITTCLFWLINKNLKSEEMIIYFPINPNISFLDAKTEITNTEKDEIMIRSHSRLEALAYLRQDISLIFANGRLIGKMGKWVEATETIENQEQLLLKNNSLIRAITYHHAELHEDSSYSSSQALSSDYLYFIEKNELGKKFSFQEPTSDDQGRWKEVLDNNESALILESADLASRTFALDPHQFVMIPLSSLMNYQNNPLPGFSMEQTQKILGQLWEGLYKNYFLNIKKQDGTIVSPLNSTIPIIYLAKNQKYLYVSFITADGEPILLKQNISN